MKENSKNVKVNEICFKNFILSTYVNENKNIFYKISKRFYIDKVKITQKLTITREEIPDFIRNSQSLVLNPSLSIKAYYDKKYVESNNNDLYFQ